MRRSGMWRAVGTGRFGVRRAAGSAPFGVRPATGWVRFGVASSVMRAQLDQVVRVAAQTVTNVWFRDVEVVGRDRLPASGPVVIVASHFNGLLDPMLVAAIAPRVPRFLAKATLWRNAVVARLLDLAGVVPVHRSAEGPTRRNVQAFAAAHRVLADGESVALFPEGITHDEPRISRIRTGAARIALGARQAGAQRLSIVPVGIIYTAKAHPRSRALVRIGQPIQLDRDLPEIAAGGAPAGPATDSGPDDIRAVRRLTAEIRRRLADAALDYEDAGFALTAAGAAGVTLRSPGAPRSWQPSLDDLERCARAIAAAPTPAKQAVVEAFAPYRDALTLLGLTDADVVAGDLTPAEVRWRIGRLTAIAATAPAAVAGAAVNGPAVGMVWGAGHLPLSTPMRGTARVLAGLVAFPATWAVLRWWLGRQPLRDPTLATVAAGPGCGLVALALVERVRALRSARESVARLRRHAAVLPVLSAERQALVSAVERALSQREDASTSRTA